MTQIVLPNTNITGTNLWSQVEDNDKAIRDVVNGDIGADNLASSAVTTAKIASGAVTSAKLAALDSWTTVTSFSNSWVSGAGVGAVSVSYQKDAYGFVRLRGAIQSGTMNTVAFTLPAGFRPTANEFFSVTTDGNGTAGRLDISSSGEVRPVWGTNGLVILGGITFATA